MDPPSSRRPPSSSSSSSLAAPPSQATPFPLKDSAQRASSSRRKKVALAPGHSPLDWAHLKSKKGPQLRGDVPPTLIRVSASELANHNTRQDAWTAIQGRVYNMTPYLDFHPGGVDEIMRCAGKDGTKLFMSIHRWVNFEQLLDQCLIGFLVPG